MTQEHITEPQGASSRLKAGDCSSPLFNVFVVFTNCLTINNGACPDWDFCDDDEG